MLGGRDTALLTSAWGTPSQARECEILDFAAPVVPQQGRSSKIILKPDLGILSRVNSPLATAVLPKVINGRSENR